MLRSSAKGRASKHARPLMPARSLVSARIMPVRRCARVTPQRGVALALLRRQERVLRQVILEMRGAQRALRRPDPCGELCHALTGCGSRRESLVELPLLRDQPLAERNRFAAHGLVEFLRAAPLLRRERE